MLHLLNERLKVSYLRGPLALRISHLITPGALLCHCLQRDGKWAWSWGEGSRVLLSCRGCVGCSGRFPFLSSLLFFKPESYFKLLSGELLKATRLRPHVLQPLVGREQSSESFLFSPLPRPRPEGGGHSSIHPLPS